MEFYYKVVKTPTTAHSTCSIFAPDSPGPQPIVNFGYQPEYPCNMNTDGLKSTNGYAVDMCSAPLYPSVIREKEKSPSKLREVAAPDLAEQDSRQFHHEYQKYVEDAAAKSYREHDAIQYPISGSDTSTSTTTTTPSGRDTPTTCHSASPGRSEGTNSLAPEGNSIYKSPSPPPTPSLVHRVLEPELYPPPNKGSSCGSIEVYKKSLPFRQLGWSSQGRIVNREICLPPRQVQLDSPFPSPLVPPARELPPHRRAVREPLLPMLVYHDDGEEEIVSRYNYLPFGRQARDPTPYALEGLVAEARSNGFTTEPKPCSPIGSRNWYDRVAGSPGREPLPSARKRAREGLFAAMFSRLESHPPQYNTMPDPPFPWMRR
ncbi:hypothetical protein MGYG_01157 [Nannizzia gypsea CBS 118893]|uniref:Uncharacterized protein n=1 Tax=Arthroderma gypseum (strain ATCC MYA-4604 / CBS 118893) TaxID=535722 RepID=E5QYZ6_ARTGP|nr:hypothetical protein MGYG_01157 [Nannizzia gypsea CBS 118893]EFQ98119.1 hypothetical protein MGYG_01157 [Nannizzia gypsea CBS 118893]